MKLNSKVFTQTVSCKHPLQFTDQHPASILSKFLLNEQSWAFYLKKCNKFCITFKSNYSNSTNDPTAQLITFTTHYILSLLIEGAFQNQTPNPPHPHITSSEFNTCRNKTYN